MISVYIYLLADHHIIEQTFVQTDFIPHFIASKFNHKRVKNPAVCGEASAVQRFVFLTALIRILS